MKKLSLFLIFILIVPIVLAFGTLSLSRIDFDSNDPDLRGPAFLLFGVENQRADFAQYSFSNLETTDKEIKSEKGGTITTYLEDYKIKYPVRAGNPINSVSVYKKYIYTIWYTNQHYREKCWNDGGDEAWKEPWSPYVKCLKYEQKAASGIIGSAIPDWNLKIVVSADGETHSVYLSPDKKQDSYSDLLTARLEGILGGFSGDKPVLGTHYATVYHYAIGHYLVDKRRQNDYLSYHDTGFHSCLNDAISSGTNIDTCIETYNSKSDFALLQKPYIQYELDVTGTTSEGNVVLTETPIYDYPAFTLKISTDWVGIYLPVGKPVIKELIAHDFPEGGSGYIEAIIKNDANVQASFDIQTTCISPFETIPVGIRKFGPYAEGTINIPVTGETQAKDCGICTVKVVDSSKPSVYDQKTVEICVTEAVQCSPKGETRCSDSKIEICQDVEGVLVWRTIEVCEGVCEYENGKPVCKGGPPPPLTCIEECQNKYIKADPRRFICEVGCKVSTVLSKFAILLGALAAFFAFLFGTKFGREIAGFDKKGAIWSGIVFAGIIFVVTYFYWVWALVALILFVIANIAMGGGLMPKK